MRGFRSIGWVWLGLIGCAPASPSTVATSPMLPTRLPHPSVETTQLAVEILQESQAGDPLPLELAQVRVRSLSGDRPYEKQLDGARSEWLLTDVPLGAYLEITAGKSGYTSRQTLFVPVRETAGLVNRATVILSDSPEVVRVLPADRSADVPTNSPVVVTFSEPVDPDSVEAGLAVTFGKAVSLSVGQSFSQGQLVFHRDQLGIAWNGDRTEMTLTPTGAPFPTDKDHAKRPAYRIGFATPFKDRNGNISSPQPFRLGGTSQAVTEFIAQADGVPPAAFQLACRGGADREELLLTFSEPMTLPLANEVFVPLPALPGSPLHVAHYRLSMRFKSPQRAGDARSSQAVAAGSTAVPVDDGEGGASLLPNFVAAGDTVRFSGGAEGKVASVTGTSVTLASPGLSLAVTNNETLWVAGVVRAPLSRSALFSKAQMRLGKTPSDVVLDLGQTGFLLEGSRVTLELSDILTDPAGNPILPAKRQIEAEVML